MTIPRCLLPLLLAALIAPSGCTKPKTTDTSSGEGAAADEVKTTVVAAEDLSRYTDLPATIEGYEMVSLMSKIDGYVHVVNVDIGQTVHAGEVLAILRAEELDDKVVQKERMVDQAQAEIDSRRSERSLASETRREKEALLALQTIKQGRSERLFEQGAETQEQLDEAKFATKATEASIARADAEIKAAAAKVAHADAMLHVAKSEVKQAKTMADYRIIRAPFDGIITARGVDPGAFVKPATGDQGTSLFTVTRIDKVRVVVFLPMETARWLTDGDTAEIHNIEALPGVTIAKVSDKPLAISRHSRSFDQGSRMMRAEIDVDNSKLPETSKLMPGDYGKARVNLVTWEGIPSIPEKALGSQGKDENYVVVLDENNVWQHVPVEVQVHDGERVGIISGLNVGQTIVAEDIDRVPSGTKK